MKQEDRQKLGREEITFRDVPSDEIEGCFYYECARENEPITQCITRWRKKIGDLEKAYKAVHTGNNTDPRGEAFVEALRELTPLVGQFYFESYFIETATFLLCFRCFPETPWQCLRSKEKELWKKSFDLYESVREKRRGFNQIDSRTTNVWPPYKAPFNTWIVHMPGVEIIRAAIDWRCGVEKVIADFEAWARKDWKRLKGKKRSRPTCDEALKQLGVWRLHRKLKSWSAVKAYMCTNRLPTYGEANNKDDTSALRRAGINASKKKVFPIVVIPREKVASDQQCVLVDSYIAHLIKEFLQQIIAFELTEGRRRQDS